jgi:hypothetical protein
LREKHRAMHNDPKSMDLQELEQLFEEAGQQVENIIVHQFNMLYTGNLSSLAPSQQAWIAQYLVLNHEIKRRRAERID